MEYTGGYQRGKRTMAKEQKVYTKEFKLEAVRLAETSGKPVAQLARERGDLRQLHSWVAQRVGATWQRRLCWEWASDRAGGGESPPQTRAGNCETRTGYFKKSNCCLFTTSAMKF